MCGILAWDIPVKIAKMLTHGGIHVVNFTHGLYQFRKGTSNNLKYKKFTAKKAVCEIYHMYPSMG